MKIKKCHYKTQTNYKNTNLYFLKLLLVKEELLAFCTQNKLPTHGGKLELMSRIESFLKTMIGFPKNTTKKN